VTSRGAAAWRVCLACALLAGCSSGTHAADAGASGVPVRAEPCGRRGVAGPSRPLPVEVSGAFGDLGPRVVSERVEVWARGERPPAGAVLEDAWQRACAALVFVTAELGVEATGPELALPVRVVLLSDADYAEVPGTEGSDGIMFDAAEDAGDAFLVPVGAFADEAELDDTLAHEFVHVVQGRAAPGAEAVPWYVVEGMAVSTGARHGRARHGRVTGFVREYLEEVDGAAVLESFRRFGHEDLTGEAESPEDALGQDQSVGGLWVEWLRRERPAALRELLGALRTAKDGGLDGLRLAQAEEALAAHVEATKGDWHARVAGTVFDEAALPACGPLRPHRLTPPGRPPAP
jgi:hypothetical protein